MLYFPQELEKLLLSYIKENYLAKGSPKTKSSPFNEKDFRYFAKGAKLLSDAFTEDRGKIPLNYFGNPVLRSGYLLYFLPVNFLKIVRILQEFPHQDLLSGKIRVLDVGSGPGTAMLGMMHFYAEALKQKKSKQAWFDFTLIDQNYAALQDAQALHRLYGNFLEKENKDFHSLLSVKHYDFRRGGLNRLLRNLKYHYIIVSNVLNEFADRQTQIAFIEYLIENHLEPINGRLIIVDPALRKSSRDLQHLRDQIILEKKLGFVQAPCLHQEACPLNLANQRDWCHFYFPWKRPHFIEKMDRLIGNKKEWLACSYLVLGKKKSDSAQQVVHPPKNWRVISNRMRSNGKEELVLCGSLGRAHLTRLDKNRSSVNQDWDKIQRGDIVSYQPGHGPQKYQTDRDEQVVKETPIQLLRKI